MKAIAIHDQNIIDSKVSQNMVDIKVYQKMVDIKLSKYNWCQSLSKDGWYQNYQKISKLISKFIINNKGATLLFTLILVLKLQYLGIILKELARAKQRISGCSTFIIIWFLLMPCKKIKNKLLNVLKL